MKYPYVFKDIVRPAIVVMAGGMSTATDLGSGFSAIEGMGKALGEQESNGETKKGGLSRSGNIGGVIDPQILLAEDKDVLKKYED